MSERLFIDLYLDEDVSVLVASMVRARGFNVLTTVEAGNLGVNDETQLEFAGLAERVLVTHNRVDFEKLLRQRFVANRTHAGIIIAARRPPRELSARLFRILNEFTADEMVNQVRYL